MNQVHVVLGNRRRSFSSMRSAFDSVTAREPANVALRKVRRVVRRQAVEFAKAVFFAPF